ncbi:MAG: efflux RND transporter permease subunit, partial [Spirochaetales bacterium]|nr:efflux RND transporter permease subunit [Spirochaetales bacterium]
IGIIMTDLSIVIPIALASSAILSVIIVPYLSALFLYEDKKSSGWLYYSHQKIENAIIFLINLYKTGLSYVLKKPFIVISSAIILFILTLFIVSQLGVSFLPPSDTGEIELTATSPDSYSLEQTRDKADEIEILIRKLVPEVETCLFIIESGNSIYAKIRLVKSDKRDRTVQEIIKMLQHKLNSQITDADIYVVNGGFDALLGYATGGQGYKIMISGSNLNDVMATGSRVSDFLQEDPNVTKTNADMRYGKEEIVSKLMLDYMGNLGITPYEAAVTTRIFFNGMDSGTFRQNNKDYNIKLTSDIAGEKVDENTINLIKIKTSSGKIVSLSSFTKLESKPAISIVKKRNRNITLTITAYLNTLDQGSIAARVTDYLNKIDLPYGVSWETGGTTSLISDSFTSLFIILGIAIFLVYSVMVIQFEKFVQPIIIMISIPFCLIGVVVGLLIFGSIISILPMLGIISLSGIVVNNAIVMIDYINLIRKRDNLSLEEAIINGSSSRLKPILMTTLTTFFGVLPMAFSSGNGGEIYAPLGQAISGGLITSTALTLFLVPAVYLLVERRKN